MRGALDAMIASCKGIICKDLDFAGLHSGKRRMPLMFLSPRR